MKLGISGLAELRARLEAVRAQDLMARALATQAEKLVDAVQDGLSEPPGAGEHDRPWMRTGALQASVASHADGLEAAVGSSDPAAAPQELGTSKMEARPFLAPVAAAKGEAVAQAIGDEVAAALRGGRADSPSEA